MSRRPRRVRRNPDLGDDLIAAALGVGLAVLLANALTPSPSGGSGGLGGGPSLTPSAAGQALGSAAGQFAASAATGAVAGAAESLILGPGFDLCQAIQWWRAHGAPGVCLVANLPLLPDVCLGRGSPNDWEAFRSYMRSGAFWDPGPVPPSCW